MKSKRLICFSTIVLGLFFLTRTRELPIPSQNIQGAAMQNDQALNQLLSKRYQSARRLLDLEEQRLRDGATTLARVCEAARWLRDSALELPNEIPERLVALTNYVALTKRLEESVVMAAEKGVLPTADRESAHYLNLDAQIALLRATQSR